jgi:hypothetical protein
VNRNRGLFVAWGLNNGQFMPATLAKTAADAGYTWLALQVEGNQQHYAAVRQECIDQRIAFGVWEAEPLVGSGTASVAEAGAGFYIAQAEGPRDWEAITADFRLNYPELPAAVVTNFGGLEDPANCVPLVQADFACLTECYIAQNPNATIANCDFSARQRGWKSTQPVLGLYHGVTFADYDVRGLFGWSVWLAEFLFD